MYSELPGTPCAVQVTDSSLGTGQPCAGDPPQEREGGSALSSAPAPAPGQPLVGAFSLELCWRLPSHVTRPQGVSTGNVSRLHRAGIRAASTPPSLMLTVWAIALLCVAWGTQGVALPRVATCEASCSQVSPRTPSSGPP